jgi:hypothetical protein
MADEQKQQILIDLFQLLPTDYLLGSARLASREWKDAIESPLAQRLLWHPRATFFAAHAKTVAVQCEQQSVSFQSHQEVEATHRTTLTPLDQCLHYYSWIMLWLVQRRICCSWMAHYYTSTGDMHRYWFQKHARAQRLGDAFNEVDTDLALQTVASSRRAALDAALPMFTTVPFTLPV